MQVCSLASGSSGNSYYIGTDSTRILVDAGLSGKGIRERLEQINIDIAGFGGILVTHEHDDHIKGVGILSRRYNIPVYATALTWEAMEHSLGKIAPENRQYLEPGKSFEIGDLSGEVFCTYHDAQDPIGFNFFSGDRKVSFATDTGCLPQSTEVKLFDSDVLILEANHDVTMLQKGPYPWHLKKRIMSDHGHLSNECAGSSLSRVIGGKTKHVILAHLSQENNLPSLAQTTVTRILAEAGIDTEQDITMKVASRHVPGALINF